MDHIVGNPQLAKTLSSYLLAMSWGIFSLHPENSSLVYSLDGEINVLHGTMKKTTDAISFGGGSGLKQQNEKLQGKPALRLITLPYCCQSTCRRSKNCHRQ